MVTKSTSTIAPLCLQLFTEYEQDILLARARFLSHIEKHYTATAYKKIQILLEQRVEASETPLLGELWPWFLKKIFPISEGQLNQFTELVIKWYAQYLLVVSFDQASDNEEKPVDPVVTMPLIIEASGLIFSNLEMSRFAVRMQIEDIYNHPSAGKNAFIVAVAEKVSAISSHPDPELVKAITGSKMTMLLQYLDDIGDFDEDLKGKRRSSFVTDFAIHHSYSDLLHLLQDRVGYDNQSPDLALAARQISYHSSFIANCISDRRDKIKDWLEKEINFFCAISTEAKSLAAFLTHKSGRNDEVFALEVQRRFKILASST